MKLTALNCIDFYKSGHIFQYPAKTTKVYSNFTPRSSRLAQTIGSVFDQKVVFVGLQGFIQWMLLDLFNDTFFQQPKEKVVGEYKRRMDTALGEGAVPVDHIEALHDVGYLPLLIKALPEGSAVGMKVPVFTITNTLPEFFWLPNYIETVISSEVWKPCTTATTARQYRLLLEKFAKETGANTDFILWQGHDFAARGLSGAHDAASSSIGHLLSFYGTDTVSAIDYLETYYSGRETFVGGSVPATEHSVMCLGGMEDELGTFRRLITETYPSGVVSIVSDSWDYWKVITEYATTLKSEIEARTPNALGLAKVVFRPDSGDPVEVLCGTAVIHKLDDSAEGQVALWAADILREEVVNETPHGEMGRDEVEGFFDCKGIIYKVEANVFWNRYDKQYYYEDGVQIVSCTPVELTPQEKGSVETLWDIFGGTTNEQGYRTLSQRVGLIYGDSITLERAERILQRLKEKGFASDNIVFGVGSFTYQYNTRDSYGFAMKATWGVVDGEAREIFKDPKTDNGTKKSAKGLLRVGLENGEYVLYDQQTPEQEATGELKVVFKDGVLHNYQTLEEIRKRLWN